MSDGKATLDDAGLVAAALDAAADVRRLAGHGSPMDEGEWPAWWLTLALVVVGLIVAIILIGRT